MEERTECKKMDIITGSYIIYINIYIYFFFLSDINDWLLCHTLAGLSDAAAMEMRSTAGEIALIDTHTNTYHIYL